MALMVLIALVVTVGIILAIVRMNKPDMTRTPKDQPHDLPVGPSPSSGTP